MTRPLRIGLSTCFFHADPQRHLFRGKTLLYVERSMIHWVSGGAALTYQIPTAPPAGPLVVDDWVADLDGLVLHGGSDVSPRSYGEEAIRADWEGDHSRDDYEVDLIRRFLDAGKPVLGICRGLQMLNVAYGGTLYQDLVEQGATELRHRNSELYDDNFHDVEVEAGCRLAELLRRPGRFRVNSIHHQAVKDLAPGLTVEARSIDDGVIEAVRAEGDRYAVAVQWHPEFFDPADPTLLDNAPLLGEFLDRAREHRDEGGPI